MNMEFVLEPNEFKPKDFFGLGIGRGNLLKNPAETLSNMSGENINIWDYITAENPSNDSLIKPPMRDKYTIYKKSSNTFKTFVSSPANHFSIDVFEENYVGALQINRKLIAQCILERFPADEIHCETVYFNHMDNSGDRKISDKASKNFSYLINSQIDRRHFLFLDSISAETKYKRITKEREHPEIEHAQFFYSTRDVLTGNNDIFLGDPYSVYTSVVKNFFKFNLMTELEIYRELLPFMRRATGTLILPIEQSGTEIEKELLAGIENKTYGKLI